MARLVPLRRLAAPGATRLLTATLALCLGAGLVTGLGCAPAREAGPANPEGSGEASGPRRGGTAVIGSTTDIEGVNELLVSTSRAFNDVAFQMFLHLLKEQPDFEESPPTFEPELATSYEWSDDHLELTFHLRDDVVWSDGVPVTAEDVRFTWQAQTHPDVAWDSAFYKENIEDVEVLDPHTVVFHFSEISPFQLLSANEGLILPKHAWGELPFSRWRQNTDFFRDHMVVNGPFRLERWAPQQEIVLARNESYVDPELPHLDRVIFRMIPERSNQVTQLLTGDLHLVEQVPILDIERVRASERVYIDSFWHRLYTLFLWNLDDPRFADRRVRRALTLAIDRQGMVDALWGEFGRVATSPIVQNVWAHDDSIEPWPHDPARARELLAEAGWSDHDGDGVIDKDGVAFRFDLLVNQGNQARIDAVVMAQEHLRRVGIDARPRVMEFNSMISGILDRSFDAVIWGWGMPTSLELRYAYHSAEIGTGTNYSGYSNPEVDRLIEEMEGLADIEDAEEILHRLQQIIHQDQPVTFLWESQRINGVSRRLHDVDANLLSTYSSMKRWWLEPAG